MPLTEGGRHSSKQRAPLMATRRSAGILLGCCLLLPSVAAVCAQTGPTGGGLAAVPDKELVAKYTFLLRKLNMD
jgi:hypothetical protein